VSESVCLHQGRAKLEQSTDREEILRGCGVTDGRSAERVSRSRPLGREIGITRERPGDSGDVTHGDGVRAGGVVRDAALA